MTTLRSPADPLFFSHHAYIDLLLTIYLKCRVGLGKLTTAQMANNVHTFVSCPHRTGGGNFTSASTLTMRAGQYNKTPLQVSTPGQVMYPFFKDLPTHFYALADVSNLGNQSYQYQATDLVGQMYTKCKAANASSSRRLAQAASVVGEQTTTVASSARRTSACKVHSDESSSQEGSAGSDNDPISDEVIPENDASSTRVHEWATAMTTLLHEQGHANVTTEKGAWVELEKMVCMFYDQCRGGIVDYSDEFKKEFSVLAPAPCKTIVDSVKAGENMTLANWKELMEQYFPCDVTGMPTGGSS